MEAFLTRRGWLAAGEREQLAASIEADVRAAIARQEAVGAPPLASLVEDVFEEPTWNLREQLAELERGPRAKSAHQH
jgi:TPP-dependent pyruvate/acetoin dehydrogenase alpha subunit